ncbi:hypothetical protein [Sinomonas atrocyanea]|uniref:hypothetical protein n=1 Tax=Sinomonas atrocyanea TaxID=37927 RepID=UPI00082F5B65|nr:hypothetical protein [Sinomonas atrocyanea]
MVAGKVEEREQAGLCCPTPLRGISRVEQAEAAIGHAVGRGQPTVCEHPRIVLGLQSVGVVQRAGLEADLNWNGLFAAGDVEPFVPVDEVARM